MMGKSMKAKVQTIREAGKAKLEQIIDKKIILSLFKFICVENIPFRIMEDGFDILLYEMNDNSINKLLNQLFYLISLEYKTVSDINDNNKIAFSIDLNDDN
jgi:hypothetical protein